MFQPELLPFLRDMRGDVNGEQNEQNGLICAKIRVEKSSFTQTHQQTSGCGNGVNFDTLDDDGIRKGCLG